MKKSFFLYQVLIALFIISTKLIASIDAQMLAGVGLRLNSTTVTGVHTDLTGFGITWPVDKLVNAASVKAAVLGQGYITGISSGMVTSALGFTPYNASNPSSFISSINSSMIATALGYTPFNSSGTPLQYTKGNGTFGTFNSDVRSNLSLSVAGSATLPAYDNSTGVITVPYSKVLKYRGITDGSGNYTVVFSVPFVDTPVITVALIAPSSKMYFCQVTAKSKTGFTANAYGFSTVSSLPIIGALAGALLGTTTSPVVGTKIEAIVVENN